MLGHIQTEGKCKLEDVDRWKKKTQKGIANHMAGEQEDEHDPEDDYYRVMMSTSHKMLTEGNTAEQHQTVEPDRNTGHFMSESDEQGESVMTH